MPRYASEKVRSLWYCYATNAFPTGAMKLRHLESLLNPKCADIWFFKFSHNKEELSQTKPALGFPCDVHHGSKKTGEIRLHLETWGNNVVKLNLCRGDYMPWLLRMHRQSYSSP